MFVEGKVRVNFKNELELQGLTMTDRHDRVRGTSKRQKSMRDRSSRVHPPQAVLLCTHGTHRQALEEGTAVIMDMGSDRRLLTGVVKGSLSPCLV